MEPETIVIFRFDIGEYDNVLAIFPEVPGTVDPSTCMCYAHVGQHGSCDPYVIIQRSRPATPDEYRALKRELESEPYKYRLKIAQKCTRRMYEQRCKAIADSAASRVQAH